MHVRVGGQGVIELMERTGDCTECAIKCLLDREFSLTEAARLPTIPAGL